MQYVFFNNDSRFYKINVNLLNLLKDISTQGTSVILCAWWLGLTLQKKLPLPPPFRRLWEAFIYFCSLHVDINYLFVQVIPN